MAKQALSSTETEALHHFARTHGRTWKQELRDEWMRACAGIHGHDQQTLQWLRNCGYFGPSGLIAYRLPAGFVFRKVKHHKFGERQACTVCGQDIEFHGHKAGWLDRGGGTSCLTYYDRKQGEYVHPEGKHTPY